MLEETQRLRPLRETSGERPWALVGEAGEGGAGTGEDGARLYIPCACANDERSDDGRVAMKGVTMRGVTMRVVAMGEWRCK
jgi:hypothetical protein